MWNYVKFKYLSINSAWIYAKLDLKYENTEKYYIFMKYRAETNEKIVISHVDHRSYEECALAF